MTHPRYVAKSVVNGFTVETILLSSGDCFESNVFDSTGREILIWQTIDREAAVNNHNLLCRFAREGNFNGLENFYVSFVKTTAKKTE